MAKQMYSSRTHAAVAWEPLKDWLYKNPLCTSARLKYLTTFTKLDDDFHLIVAKCLWRLANGVNMPWGRAALQSSVYSNVPIAEKVLMSEYTFD